MDLMLLVAVLLAGGLAGFLLRRCAAWVARVRDLTPWALGLMLCLMGAKLASHRVLFTQDWRMMLAAVGSSALLVGLLYVAFILFPGGNERAQDAAREAQDGAGSPGPQGSAAGSHELGVVAANCGWILGGFIAMVLLPLRLQAVVPLEALADGLLRLLLAFIGFDLGAELHRLELRRLTPKLLLVPFLNILFSLGCGALFGLLARHSAREGMLMVSGLGWYSLSSVLIAGHGLALLSVLAFIHNVFRELFTILLVPLAARVSPLLPVYMGGATTMDVLLPFVQRYCGRRYTLVSFYSGVVCSLAVLPLVRTLTPPVPRAAAQAMSGPVGAGRGAPAPPTP